MNRQSVLVMLLLTLAGLLVGSKATSFMLAQPVPEYVPPPPSRRAIDKVVSVAKPTLQPVLVDNPVPVAQSRTASETTYSLPPHLSYLYAPVSNPLTQESIGSMLDDQASEELHVLPSPPTASIGPDYYPTLPSSITCEYPSTNNAIDQAPEVYPPSSDGSNSVTLRYQMALERAANGKETVVVICDTATGRCWHGNLGSSQWSNMGSPVQSSQASVDWSKHTEEVSCVSTEGVDRPVQVSKQKPASAWDEFFRF